MKQSIIYQIRCFPNGKIYIGKTKNPGSRWSNHKSKLRSGRHHCPALQSDWDHFGERFFDFHCVAIEAEHEDMEALYISAVSDLCYNRQMKKRSYEKMVEEYETELPDEFLHGYDQ